MITSHTLKTTALITFVTGIFLSPVAFSEDYTFPCSVNNGAFTLKSTSPCIDAGAFLFKITSETGSGTTFQVTGTFMFEKGKRLKTESKQVGVVVDINGNSVTVDQPISWTKGEGVHRMYYGEAPDIGACEYIPQKELAPPGGLRLKTLVSESCELATLILESPALKLDAPIAIEDYRDEVCTCNSDTKVNTVRCLVNARNLLHDLSKLPIKRGMIEEGTLKNFAARYATVNKTYRKIRNMKIFDCI